MPDRRRVAPARHKPGEMSHVDHEQRSDVVSYLPEAAKVKESRIRGGPGDQDLGPVLFGQPGHHVHVYQL